MDRLRIFSRNGTLLAEFTASVRRSWIIGKRTIASFSVSVYDTYCNETVLQFGNWVIVENDNFPDWVGTIGGREWASRKATIAAYSPEFLLGQRIGPREEIVKGSAGVIFERIIYYVNLKEKTLLRGGNIVKSGTRIETLNPTQLNDDLRRIYERSGEEYTWRADFDANGKLSILGDWSLKLGKSTEFSLYESKSGGNVEATRRVLVEDAPEGNSIFGYGSGLTWASKPVVEVPDAASINQYGLIQKSISYNGVSTLAGITTNARDELKTLKNPERIYNINALNVGDTYKFMALGNSMYLRMQNIGFSSGDLGTDVRVRIVGMYFNPDSGNKLELVVKETT